jgi:hypothetical protein
MEQTGTRISRATTTGWLDWMHGELWLLPDGLLRTPSGWMASIANGMKMRTLGALLPATDSSRTFDDGVFANGSATWLSYDLIESAALHTGIIHDRLRVVTSDGRTRKLLWLRSERVTRKLEPVLRQRLGARFLVD